MLLVNSKKTVVSYNRILNFRFCAPFVMSSKLNRNTNGCCVNGCYNKQKNSKFSFFTLPSDCEARNKWLEVIGRPDLLNKPNLKPQSYKICSVHFEKSMMFEVLVRKLLPGAVPTKFLSTKSQASTSTCALVIQQMESQSSEVSTQTKRSYTEESSIFKIKNASMPMVHTQIDSPINERGTQTSLALLSRTKWKLITQLQESEKMKTRLQNKLDTTKQETNAKNSLSCSPSANQSVNGDDDEVSEKFVKKVRTGRGRKFNQNGDRPRRYNYGQNSKETRKAPFIYFVRLFLLLLDPT